VRRNTVPAVLVVALSFAVTIAVYPDLPGEMAIHWGASGTTDGSTSKPVGAFLLPAHPDRGAHSTCVSASSGSLRGLLG